MDSSELLQRLSETMRHDIGPKVDEEFARTQAFMVSVILERLSREVALANDHSQAEFDDTTALAGSLSGILTEGPEAVRQAHRQLADAPSMASLATLIEALYAWGPHDPAVVAALDQIRPVLRRDIDRRMEIAR